MISFGGQSLSWTVRIWRAVPPVGTPPDARIVERAFGLGASALAEVVQIINGRLNMNAA